MSVFTESGSARQEAERLVAAALAFASLAANSHPELATGSAACCVCPFCKLIEAVRDPDPHFVERLATGAGDLATGVASLLRNLAPEQRTETADPWKAATAESEAADEERRPAPKAAAGRKAQKGGTPPQDAPQRNPDEPVTARPIAKKALAKKALATKTIKKEMP